MGRYQTKREVWQVTEYRDGCIYRTEKIGEEWVDADITLHPEHPDKTYAPTGRFEVRRIEPQD